MKFQAKTDKEIAEERLLPDGKYGFEISGGEDTTSKAGNDMIKLTVRVFKDDGSFLLVDDYLMEKMMFKLKQACDACGLLDKYQSGQILGSDFIGKTGELELIIQEDKTGNYPARNSVKKYLIPEGGEAVKPKGSNAAAESGDDDLEDSIPF